MNFKCPPIKFFNIILSFFLFLFVISCSNQKALLRNKPLKFKPPVLFELEKEGKVIRIANVETDKSIGDKPIDIKPGDIIGKVAPYPTPRSDKFENEIEQSQSLYGQGKYYEAMKALEDAYKNESNNPFILNSYACAMYKIDSLRPKSRKIYLELIEYLDNLHLAEQNIIVIDMWFAEAYWKFGTLLLDIGEYKKAIIEIQKAIYALLQTSPKLFQEQAYSYLTEAYYFLNECDKMKYFGYETLNVNSNNQYVLEFINEIDKCYDKKRANEVGIEE